MRFSATGKTGGQIFSKKSMDLKNSAKQTQPSSSNRRVSMVNDFAGLIPKRAPYQPGHAEFCIKYLINCKLNM